ncbi:hypothetical protein ACKAWY_02040 [Xanthomonas vasicola pv. vasculorum]|uniref:hypothetical protein n=1 Tax=Xanthomonas vasicola TaxID=56459 RepID=UPI0013747A3C|nr:hypothetical protein [Xanthomonas vasicola]MDO6971298.1 hypothetical protein [Xanthomonas vasicola]HHZ40699.1 hypothetical protein [Xanthomonas vasicola pv. zeae]HHZ44766.1 hypothetical protein [Xanthomonas vasicola pv. zeae]HHZ56772.1 hypothetical protein [Xanthomonas vasicola pv. zeae]
MAAHKKDAFTDQYAGSLRKPTSSTESANSTQWLSAFFGQNFPAEGPGKLSPYPTA